MFASKLSKSRHRFIRVGTTYVNVNDLEFDFIGNSAQTFVTKLGILPET